jgi:superoxide dismutase, Cu-Zn family
MRTPILAFAAATAALALAALVGCGTMRGAGGTSAVAELQPTRGNSASGNVRFTQQADGVLVAARVSGLNPGQQHGFHIHEKGDCSSGDGASAGGHFNPGGQPHGPQDAAHHAGDLPALRADSTGSVNASFSVKGLTIGAGPNDIVGKGLIVHTAPDDYTTQPTGNAGARIACAVIVKS